MTQHRQFKQKAICAYDACKKEFYPRVADVNRGWGKFCSKTCKAKCQVASKKKSKRSSQPHFYLNKGKYVTRKHVDNSGTIPPANAVLVPSDKKGSRPSQQ